MTSEKPAIVLGAQLYLIMLIVINGFNAYRHFSLTDSLLSPSAFIAFFFAVTLIASEVKAKWSHRLICGAMALFALILIYVLVSSFSMEAFYTSSFAVLMVFLVLSAWLLYSFASDPITKEYYYDVNALVRR